MSNVTELENKIIESNISYRNGSSIISDQEYDLLLEELSILDPTNHLLTIIGSEVPDNSRKRRLDISMASMNKVKTISELEYWIKSKSIPKDIELVLTPKYDGLSLCVNEEKGEATTRGNGTIGQDVDRHYSLIGNHHSITNSIEYSYGEVIMSRKSFEKYSNFANARNFVSGLINSKTPSDGLSDCVYVKYGAVGGQFSKKSEMLDHLNEGQEVKIHYKKIKYKDLSEDILISLFKECIEYFKEENDRAYLNSIHGLGVCYNKIGL